VHAWGKKNYDNVQINVITTFFCITFVGDEWSDPKLMEYIGATKIKALGNNL
jgi:hypothetical protein